MIVNLVEETMQTGLLADLEYDHAASRSVHQSATV